jgi:hypothetical protein
MTSILAVDLAVRSYQSIGLAVLTSIDGTIAVNFVRPAQLGLAGAPDVARLAGTLTELAQASGATVIAIDGPQAWKDPDNGLEHSRLCERLLYTQAKTGLPGVVKPGLALRFVEFSIQLFDCLAELGWPRLTLAPPLPPPSGVALEVFPTAVWRALGLKPLPAKNSPRGGEVIDWRQRLQSLIPFTADQEPSHDELQALVAGLVGLAFASDEPQQYALHGAPPFLCEGTWREGYIVNLSKDSVR